jgi:hypothetical protein
MERPMPVRDIFMTALTGYTPGEMDRRSRFTTECRLLQVLQINADAAQMLMHAVGEFEAQKAQRMQDCIDGVCQPGDVFDA